MSFPERPSNDDLLLEKDAPFCSPHQGMSKQKSLQMSVYEKDGGTFGCLVRGRL
jgi:hypothetical protein